jgi:hypothetical protein
MKNEIKVKFADLALRLSPENLSCDGLLSRKAQDFRKAEIMKEWKQLEQECGEKVSMDQAEDWMIEGFVVRADEMLVEKAERDVIMNSCIDVRAEYAV